MENNCDNTIISPVYAQIALDIATRISNGELKENTKIYGRSIMSSEYGVSPETIRRSMKLLEDMKIVTVIKNSGTMVLSAENANLYVERFGEKNKMSLLQKKLNELIKHEVEVNQQIVEISSTIMRMNDKFSETNPFENYQIEIPPSSYLIGKTLAELNFWQETMATVIAVRREGTIILSPGPYVLFQEKDILIFIGDIKSVQAVKEYINR